MNQNEIPYDPHYLGVPSGVSKMIFEPKVRLVQSVHLSCTNSNTVSKWTELRFHMTHVTKVFHWVRPKQFSSLWCVRRKLCTYLAPTLMLSPNVPKLVLHGSSHLWVLLGASNMILSLWYVQRKPCNYLMSRLALSANGLERDSTWSTSPRSSIACVQNDFRAYGTFDANHASILRQK
jgi:hypothetical protein